MIIILAFILDHLHGQHGYLSIVEEVAIICIRVAKIICMRPGNGDWCLPGSQDKPQMEMDAKCKSQVGDFIWTERFSFQIDVTDLIQA